jgi:hypothetical protein
MSDYWSKYWSNDTTLINTSSIDSIFDTTYKNFVPLPKTSSILIPITRVWEVTNENNILYANKNNASLQYEQDLIPELKPKTIETSSNGIVSYNNDNIASVSSQFKSF